MSLAYVHLPEPADVGGTYCPVVVCDACHERITGSGNVYWLVLPSGDLHPDVWHTHKWPCSDLDRALEADHGGLVMSDELDVWLGQLRRNVLDQGAA